MRGRASLAEAKQAIVDLAALAAWWRESHGRVAAEGRLLWPVRSRQFGAFGPHSVVHRPTFLAGTSNASIGREVLIMTGVWLAVEPQARARGHALHIGDRAGMRAWCTISVADEVNIGDDVVFGASVTVVDSNHTWRQGNPRVLDNELATAPIAIGRGSWLGDRAVVLPGAEIGERCAIGAGAIVNGTIPDGSIAVGAPARVVGRSEDL